MSEPFIGQINYFPWDREHYGWLICNGQEVIISNYYLLFSLIDTRFGGDGKTTFRVPNLMGAVAVGVGKSNPYGHDWKLGKRYGEDFVQIDSDLHIPRHNHKVYFAGTASTTGVAKEGAMLSSIAPPQFWASTSDKKDTQLNRGALGLAYKGRVDKHENRQPYLVLTPMIAYNGEYPDFSDS